MNAKDPTLAKINAGPDMMGLYTAGIGLGIEFESLAKTMMSASGNMINTLLGGNIFNGQSANRLSDVIKYIDEGPDIEVAPGRALAYLTVALKSVQDNPDVDALITWESETAYYGTLDAYSAMDTSDIRAALLKLVNKSDAKTLVKAFRLAIEGTLKTFKELREIRKKIEDEEAKFEDLDQDVEEALLVEHNKRLKELKESIPDYDKLTTATAERRYLSKMMLKWLDYTLKKRISLSNYLTVGSGDTVNLWDNKKHKLRTADWECMYPGDAYLKGGLAIPFVAWAKEPTKEEIETYKEKLAKWKETTWQVFKDKWKAESDRQWEAYNAEAAALHKDNKGANIKKKLKNKKPDVYHSEEYLKERDALLLTRPSLFKYIDGNGVELDRRIFGKGIPVYNAYDSIRKLNDVNNEMGKLRDRLKLNQGLPNNIADLFAAIRSFNKLMQDQFSVYKKSLPVIDDKKMKVPDDVASAVEEFDVLDLNRFILDELYRNRAIETYDKIKTAFNVLDAVWEVPHYRGYLKALNALFEGERINSARYRLSHQLGNSVLTAEEDGDLAMSGGSKEITRIYSQAGKFVLYKMNNMFLQLSDMTIGLNPGQQFVDKNGKILTALGRTSIQLGTPQGNASFRLWFELICVPNMQRGFFGKYKETGGKVTNVEDHSVYANKFIRDLAKEKNTRTISGNATYAYTLPISMLARSESEQEAFNVYKSAFNSLNKNRYYFLTIDDSGKVIQYGIPVLDLFFAYNLIVYGGESNLNSFSTIFEDLLRNKTLPIQEDYNKFVSGFDENGELIEGEDYTRNELLSWLAPRVYNAKAAKAPYIRIYDPDTMRIILAEKGTEQNNGYEDPNTGEKFTDILTGSYYTKIDTDNNMQYNHNYVIDLPNGNRVLRLNSTDYAEVINGNLTRVKRNGKTYTALLLIDLYDAKIDKLIAAKKKKDPKFKGDVYRLRAPKIEDFTVLEEVFAEGNSNITRPSRTYVDTLLQEIFNPICE